TILGDTAVCVHPEDPRYQHLQGKSVIVPMVNRVVPVIRDSYVDIDFGTGALKITPAHDENDYEIGLRHKLKVIDIFNEDGTLSQAAGLFTGVDRFEARKLAAEKLKELGVLVKVEEYTNKVGYSERTDVVIEPRLSKQWFLKMDDLAEPALQHILNGDIRIYPSKFINTYRHWMENIHDWCISRQLWWGHRIPAWYLDDDTVIVAENASIALEKARSRTGNKALTLQELHQDEDVLDTWFSSWLWPISVFDGIRDPGNRDINYYYPTNDLVTAPDILFFWVARMIIAGYEYRREKPFEHVYLTGTVRDHLRRKMSKSLGNSPDPLKLIAQYGADGVRVGMLLCSPAGNDLLFDESLTEQGRNFGNKIWNAFRLVQGWQVDEKAGQSEIARIAVQWFRSRLNKVVGEIDDYFKKYRLSDALMTVYRLFWDDFSSWYLELIKPPYGEPTDAITYRQTIEFLDQLMRLLHPFMPFITEEIWHHLMPGRENKSVMVSQWPKGGDWDSSLIDRFAQMQEAVVFVRSVRAARNIPFKNKINLKIRVLKGRYDREMEPLMVKLLNLDEIMEVQDHPEGLMGQVIRTVAYYVEIHQEVNPDEEIKRITKELNYSRGFLQATLKKLQNQRFMEHAPESVVAAEKKKKVDAETRIKALEEQLKKINDHGAI
ncbi:MAG: valine--tRNA ligase, partial [Bacteroidales bacterium]|nr:valine--tRNA ligase [Bacteroidales bacterium]